MILSSKIQNTKGKSVDKFLKISMTWTDIICNTISYILIHLFVVYETFELNFTFEHLNILLQLDFYAQVRFRVSETFIQIKQHTWGKELDELFKRYTQNYFEVKSLTMETSEIYPKKKTIMQLTGSILKYQFQFIEYRNRLINWL